MRIQTILSMFPRVVLLLSQLFLIWITLDWKVRKARKAFEKELMRQGIPKEDARRLSIHIRRAKNQMMRSLWKFAHK